MSHSYSKCHQLGYFSFFFFNDTATTEIYTLSLHDALPILKTACEQKLQSAIDLELVNIRGLIDLLTSTPRSEEHTSELQSQSNLVCRLLLEKKKSTYTFLF